MRMLVLAAGMVLLRGGTLASSSPFESRVGMPFSEAVAVRDGRIGGLPSPRPTASPTANPSAIYSTVLPTLEAGTSVRILLPSNLSRVYQALYASLGTVSSTEYTVMLGSVANCNSATVCRQIDVTGATVNGSVPSMTGTKVTLSNGTTAYFTGATCGASCGSSLIT